MASFKLLLHRAGPLLAILALVGSAYLTWTGLVAGAFGELAEQVRILQEEAQRGRDLESRVRLLSARAEDKDQLALEVAAGRLSLVEGAARFRDLCQTTPGFSLKMLRLLYPSDSEEESYCWALIVRVRKVLADDPAQARAAAGRLGAELTELLHQGSPLFPL
jgi:hypothetical protein